MHFKFRHIQKIVGGFFILTCCIIVGLLMMVARGQRWFQKYIPYSCYFSDGAGIRQGSVVMIQGLEAGIVTRLELSDNDKIRIDLGVFKQYADRIREKSEARILKPVIGSNSLQIVTGPQDAPLLLPGGTIASDEEESASLDSLIASATGLVKKLGDPESPLFALLDNLDRASFDLAEILASKDGTVPLLLRERKVYDELKATVAHLEKFAKTLDDSSPDVRDSVTDVRRGVEEANKVIRAMEKSVFIRGNMERYLHEDATLKNEGR